MNLGDVAAMNRVIAILKRETRKLKVPVVTLIARTRRDPFKVLVSCILSLRTKDETTIGASGRLFEAARTPREILRLPVKKLERLIYPVGFYRVKARVLHAAARDILGRFGGKVPSEIEDLLTLKGVGRKTANLVRTLGFGKPGICVDIHVHRISNRLGFIRTRDPRETEFALRKKLPRRHWIGYNDILVAYGQHLCRPVSPWCSKCKVSALCRRVGVTSRR